MIYKQDLEKKISSTDKKYLILADFLKKTEYNAKITKIESR